VGGGEEITQWITQLGHGDQQAAEMLWQKYFDKLVRYARHKLDGMPRREADEEDVALSAMQSFCRGMTDGRFQEIGDRQDLWKLLLTLTARKACAQKRRHYAEKRGAGAVRGESVFGEAAADQSGTDGIGQVLGTEPTAELADMLAEDCRRLLDSLGDDTLRRVALWTLEGYSPPEIAEKLGCVRRSVERKLERVREKWSFAMG
jgi:DNA-directed RNA polymerase specialized sigma24 family protein